jgi:hypothetical protein
MFFCPKSKKFKDSFKKIASSISQEELPGLDKEEIKFIEIFYNKLKQHDVAWREIQSIFYETQGNSLRIIEAKVSSIYINLNNLIENKTEELSKKLDSQKVIIQEEFNEVQKGINKVKQSIEKLESSEKKEGKFKIVEYRNDKDLFMITVLNNSSDSKFISKVELKLTNRKPLAFVITPMNKAPYSNEEILINLYPNQDNYSLAPNIYIEPKSAEILNFRLHRPDAYYGFEIMETVFEVTTDDDQVYKTEKLIDHIGHSQMFLKIDEKYQQEKKEEIVSIMNHNREMIQSAVDSKLRKSNRLIFFLNSYLQQESDLQRIYNLEK